MALHDLIDDTIKQTIKQIQLVAEGDIIKHSVPPSACVLRCPSMSFTDLINDTIKQTIKQIQLVAEGDIIKQIQSLKIKHS